MDVAQGLLLIVIMFRRDSAELALRQRTRQERLLRECGADRWPRNPGRDPALLGFMPPVTANKLGS